MSLKSLVLSGVVVVVLLSRIVLSEESKTFYRVMGASTQSNEVRPWSQPFDSRFEANIELESLKKSHAKGGLLEFSRDKPANLYVAEFELTSDGRTIAKASPTAEQPLQGGRGGRIANSDSKPVVQRETNGPNLKGKRYVGQINGDNVTLEFGDGDVQFSGDRVGPAKFSVLITKILIQSERTRYIGTIEGDKISGTFERLDGSEKGNWNMALTEPPVGTWEGRGKDGSFSVEISDKGQWTLLSCYNPLPTDILVSSKDLGTNTYQVLVTYKPENKVIEEIDIKFDGSVMSVTRWVGGRSGWFSRENGPHKYTLTRAK